MCCGLTCTGRQADGQTPYPAAENSLREALASLPQHVSLTRSVRWTEGYAVVIQDVRGRHASGGEWYPYANEAIDGYDTIDWIASQSWSDGTVGMFGISYHGATQWLAATEAHPALKAIVPGVTADSYYDSWTYLGGVFQLFWISGWASGFVLDDFPTEIRAFTRS